MTDLYREMTRKGGIPETQFMALYVTTFDPVTSNTYPCNVFRYPGLFNWGRSFVEDSANAHFEHPFFDEYWQSKVPCLENITCPAYIVCSWGDNGIHTRGTLNGWKKISSKDKYLEIHPYQKQVFSLPGQ
jgi:predicted acyl esterase